MKKLIIIFLLLSSCVDVQPRYEPFHMELLAYLFTSTQELSLYCEKESSPKIKEILSSLRKNSVYLKNHMMGLNITGDFDYSVNIWNPIKNFDELYQKQNKVSVYFCNKQISTIQEIIKKSMQIEALRKNR